MTQRRKDFLRKEDLITNSAVFAFGQAGVHAIRINGRQRRSHMHNALTRYGTLRHSAAVRSHSNHCLRIVRHRHKTICIHRGDRLVRAGIRKRIRSHAAIGGIQYALQLIRHTTNQLQRIRHSNVNHVALIHQLYIVAFLPGPGFGVIAGMAANLHQIFIKRSEPRFFQLLHVRGNHHAAQRIGKGRIAHRLNRCRQRNAYQLLAGSKSVIINAGYIVTSNPFRNHQRFFAASIARDLRTLRIDRILQSRRDQAQTGGFRLRSHTVRIRNHAINLTAVAAFFHRQGDLRINARRRCRLSFSVYHIPGILHLIAGRHSIQRHIFTHRRTGMLRLLRNDQGRFHVRGHCLRLLGLAVFIRHHAIQSAAGTGFIHFQFIYRIPLTALGKFFAARIGKPPGVGQFFARRLNRYRESISRIGVNILRLRSDHHRLHPVQRGRFGLRRMIIFIRHNAVHLIPVMRRIHDQLILIGRLAFILGKYLRACRRMPPLVFQPFALDLNGYYRRFSLRRSNALRLLRDHQNGRQSIGRAHQRQTNAKHHGKNTPHHRSGHNIFLLAHIIAP